MLNRLSRGLLRTLMIMTLAITGFAHSAADKPPNILLLVAEDLGPRLGSFGDNLANTPNIDSLAQRSTRFTQAFTTAGVCAPSRAALITGQHQISFGGQHMRSSTSPWVAIWHSQQQNCARCPSYCANLAITLTPITNWIINSVAFAPVLAPLRCGIKTALEQRTGDNAALINRFSASLILCKPMKVA